MKNCSFFLFNIFSYPLYRAFDPQCVYMYLYLYRMNGIISYLISIKSSRVQLSLSYMIIAIPWKEFTIAARLDYKRVWWYLFFFFNVLLGLGLTLLISWYWYISGMSWFMIWSMSLSSRDSLNCECHGFFFFFLSKPAGWYLYWRLLSIMQHY